MSFAAVISGIAVAAAGGFAMSAILAGVVTAAASLYQQRQSKNAAADAKAAAEAAADAAKGFQIVQEGEAKSLPVVYGRALIGGVRVYAKTFNSFSNVSTPAQVFAQGLGSMGGEKHEFLITQQALCVEGVHRCVAVDVADVDSQDAKYAHGQRIAFYRNGGTPCPIMSANDGSRVYSKFTGAAFATGAFRLNRDEYQYSGIPEMKFYIEGMEVRIVVPSGGGYVLSNYLVYSNNPVWCLLDYLMSSKYGRGLSADDIDLKSFYLSALVCDEIVIPSVGIDGSYWHHAGVGRSVKLYELNVALDTDAPVRDNIDVILKSMGDADLIWSAGKFRINISYPHAAVPAGGAYYGLVMQAGLGIDTHLYKCVKSGTALPPGDNAGWKRVDRVVTEDDLFMDENLVQTWPSAQDRLNHFKVTFLNESKDFKEDTAQWPPKYNRVDGPQVNRGQWSSANAYDTSDTVVYSGVSYQLTRGFDYSSSTPPPSDPMWVTHYSTTVFATFKREDNEIALEGTESLAFASDYYHALAYAENKVRLSRTKVGFTIAISFEFWETEPGDFLHITAPSLGINGELVKVLAIEVMTEGFLKIDVEKFDARQLAWNAKDNEVIAQRNTYDMSLPQAVGMYFTRDTFMSSGSVGRLCWVAPKDVRVSGYAVKYTTTPPEMINENTLWIDLGTTKNTFFDVRAIPAGYYVMTAVSMSKNNLFAPKFNLISGSKWPAVSVGIAAPFVDNTQMFFAAVYTASATEPNTPVGGAFNFIKLIFDSLPANWTVTPPLSTLQLYRSEAVIRATDGSIVWGAPVTVSNPGTYAIFTKSVLVVTQDEAGNNVGYLDAITKLKAVLGNVDVSSAAGTTYELISAINCTATIVHTGPSKGTVSITSLTGDGGSITVRVRYAGGYYDRTAAVTIFRLGYIADVTPPPPPTAVRVSTSLNNVFIELDDIPNYTEGHGHRRMLVFATNDVTKTFADAKQIYSTEGIIASFGYTIDSPLYLWFVNESRDGGESEPYGGLHGIDASTGVIDSSMIDPSVFVAVSDINIATTSYVMRFNGAKVAYENQDITLVANRHNVSTNVVWAAKAFDLAGISIGPVMLVAQGSARLLTVGNFGAANSVKVTVTADGLSDTTTIVRVEEGAATLNGILTNEAINLAADAEGNILSYTCANGQFLVYLGTAAVKTGVVFEVINQVGVLATINATTGLYSFTNLTLDNAQATFRATVSGRVIDKVATLIRSRTGPRGSRGNIKRYVTDPSYYGWSDSVALTAVGTTPIQGDEVTIANGSTFAELRYFDGAAWVLPGMVIDGSALVKGTVTAEAIMTNSINSTHISAEGITSDKIRTGELLATTEIRCGGHMIISADGWIESYAADGYSRADDYVRLDSGNVEIYKYVPALGGTVKYNALSRTETGVATNNTVVTIPGYWKTQPKLIVSPNSLMLYDNNYTAQDQAIQCQAENIVETAAGSMRWKFTPIARLILAAATNNVVVGASSGAIAANSWTSGTYTTPANCTSINPFVQFNSYRGNGSSQYFYRSVKWRVDYYNGSAWVLGAFRTMNFPANTTTNLTDNVTLNFPSSGTWQWRIYSETYDTSTAVFGSVGYTYATERVYASNGGYDVTNEVAGDHTVGVNLSYNAKTKGGEIYSITYGGSISLGVRNKVGDGTYCSAESAMAGSTTIFSSIQRFDLRNYNYPTPRSFSYSHTVNGSNLTKSLKLSAVRSNVEPNYSIANAQLEMNVTAGSQYADLSLRTVIANSTTPANTYVLQNYNYSLSTATIIATGSLNWIALGE